jgi:hypothetical protein
MDAARRAVGRSLRNGETLPALALHRDAEARQQVQRDLDVGLGDQLAHHLDHHRAVGADQRQCQQQRGQELAGDITSHGDGARGVQRVLRAITHAQRRVAGLPQVGQRAAQGAQRIDQVADRPLVHARHAGQLEHTALGGGQHGQRGGQRSHRGAGIAQEELRLARLQPAAQAGDVQHLAVAA